jgi:AcrR family transcriptional regulator
MLLAERPPEALTIDAIVEAAGVAKGTFSSRASRSWSRQ